MADERTPRYSREEVEEILRRAAERTHADGDALRHEDLVAAAREVGIDVGALEDAAAELALRREDERAIRAWDARRKRRFASHLLTFLIVHAGLFLLNLLTGGAWWFLFPLLAWGIAVALHAASALPAPSPEQIERVSRKERRRREAERKREARRVARAELRDKLRRARSRRGAAEEQFEQAVEAGVAAVMEVVARKIAQTARRLERPLADTEFNRYVARKKGETPPGAARAAEPPARRPGPRVRVEGAEEEDLEGESERRERRGRDRS